MDLKLGKYRLKGPHKGCKCKGKVMECSLQFINNKAFPPNIKVEWLWCNGSIWDGEHQTFERCGASNRENKKVKVEVE